MEGINSSGPTGGTGARSIAATQGLVPASASRSNSVTRVVPTLLAFVAGYVDSCTFLAFNGLFVAQLTGSFVVAGSEFSTRNERFLVEVLAIPAFFAAGMLTTLIVRSFGVGSRRAWITALALEALLLVGLVWVGVSAKAAPATSIAALFGLAAMGVQSALARLLLSDYGSTNVMTINTTQLSIDITTALLTGLRQRRNPADRDAGSSYASARARMRRLLPIMLGFLVGTIAGGIAFVSVGLICLVLAIGAIAALVVWAAGRQMNP